MNNGVLRVFLKVATVSEYFPSTRFCQIAVFLRSTGSKETLREG